MQRIKKYLRSIRKGEKGFTLIELLVVVAILGVLAAIAIPNVGSFIGEGHEDANAIEYHDILIGVSAVMVHAESHKIDTVPIDDNGWTDNLHDIYSTDNESNPIYVSDFVGNLNADHTTKTKCYYNVNTEGNVAQYCGSPPLPDSPW